MIAIAHRLVVLNSNDENFVNGFVCKFLQERGIEAKYILSPKLQTASAVFLTFEREDDWALYLLYGLGAMREAFNEELLRIHPL